MGYWRFNWGLCTSLASSLLTAIAPPILFCFAGALWRLCSHYSCAVIFPVLELQTYPHSTWLFLWCRGCKPQPHTYQQTLYTSELQPNPMECVALNYNLPQHLHGVRRQCLILKPLLREDPGGTVKRGLWPHCLLPPSVHMRDKGSRWVGAWSL